MRTAPAAIAAALLLAAAPSPLRAQAPTPPPAAILAGGCQSCHGVSGEGANGIPAIARTMTRGEFAATMAAFRENRRDATIMNRIARGYTADEIAALAAHFARPE